MANLTLNFRYPTYEPNKAIAATFASFIGISMIAWLVQSIRAQFKPRRPMVLILVSHLTIFIALILRAALSIEARNSRAGFTTTTALLAVSQRMIILANYDFITHVGDQKLYCTRMIIIGSVVGVVGSGIIMIPVGILSSNLDTLDQSFQIRQASAGILLSMTILFYPIWFATKTMKIMTKQTIILLIISSITALIVALFFLIISSPQYYLAANKEEFWYYIFQLIPIAIALFTWTTLHPKRSLVTPPTQRKDNLMEDIDNNL